MDQSSAPIVLSQHLRKVQRDLSECNSLLTHWYGCDDGTLGADRTLHSAIEALMRAVATLAEVVERAQEQQTPGTVDCIYCGRGGHWSQSCPSLNVAEGREP